jgi:hypothetical protein
VGGYLLFGLGRVVDRLAGCGVEDERGWVGVLEVEHGVQGAGLGVEGLVADAAQAPVVLDEGDDRALRGEGVVDEVGARVR